MPTGLPVRFGDALSPREQDVCELVAQGHSNAEIGKRLGIAEDTVKVHVGRAMAKLGVDNRTRLAVHWNKMQSDVIARQAREAVVAATERGDLQAPEVWSPAAVYNLLKLCAVAKDNERGDDVTGVPNALIGRFGARSKFAIRMMCQGLEVLGLLNYRAGRLRISSTPNFTDACRRVARGGRDVSREIYALNALLVDLERIQSACAA